ncbi:tyrosine-type recombinase/integrase [Paenibacillus sp. FSL P4-0502]|uniref:tyrosine-type recombinase/integrase n=1 Tax=Paenibacillus sp. FSL P4-0502 TaxID=2975319 RepID=UPI0030F7D504
MLNNLSNIDLNSASEHETNQKLNHFNSEIRSYLETIQQKNKGIINPNKLSHLKKFNDFLDSVSFDEQLANLNERYLKDYKEKISQYSVSYQSNLLIVVKSVFHFYGIYQFDHLLTLPSVRSKKMNHNPNKKLENLKILDFISYLDNFKKFSQTINNKKHLKTFYKYLKEHFPNLKLDEQSDFSNVRLHHIKEFEKYQLERASFKKISKKYVYSISRSLRMFFDYLRIKGISNIKYVPPSFLQRDSNRANEYVEVIDIRLMIDSFFKEISATNRNPKFLYRNLAIFLILLNTGCRPIEICNLSTSDIWLSEGAILLRSKKSGKRKLKLDREVVYYLKHYCEIRHTFNPKSNILFLKKDGDGMYQRNIYKVFQGVNKKTFNKMINSPKSLRHTYITNALDSLNDIRKVAEAAGHKIWSSTDYYRYRSTERLKNNTIEYDPTGLYEREFEDGHSKKN